MQDRNTIRQTLIELMEADTGETYTDIDDAKNLRVDLNLDSVDLVSVVFAIEEKYGVEIAEDAFSRSDTLAVVLQKIEALIDAKAA